MMRLRHQNFGFIALLAGLVSCAGGAVPDAGGDISPSTGTIRFALTSHDLPPCNPARDGAVWYVWNDSKYYVCRASTSTWVHTELRGVSAAIRVTMVSPGNECAAGGSYIQFGLDQNRNDVLDDAEVLDDALVCNGKDGLSSLVTTTPEPEGDHCAAGGVVVRTGLDANRNGVLDDSEVGATTYVCNGKNAEAFPVGGKISGLPDGASVELENNGGYDLTLDANGDFSFPKPIASGATYTVTVKTQPAGSYCSVRNGTGTVDSSSVTSVAVVCNRGVVALATGQRSPGAIAIDATNVYWANAGDGTVMKVPLAGGTPVVLASQQDSPSALAVDANNVYFANWDSGTLMKVPLVGGPITFITTGSSPTAMLAVPQPVTNGEPVSKIYWTNAGEGAVRDILSSGASPGLIASKQTMPNAIAVCGAQVFWTDAGSGTVESYRASSTGKLAGTRIAALATGQSYPGAIAARCDSKATTWERIYWANAGDGTVHELAPNNQPLTIASNQGSPSALAVVPTRSSEAVYWTNTADGTVMKLAKSPLVVAAGQGYPSAIAADQTNVYWTDSSDGTVMKAPR